MSAVLNIDADEHMLIGQVLVPFRSRALPRAPRNAAGSCGLGVGNLLRAGETFDRFEAIGAHSGGAPENSSPSGCCTPWRAQSSAEAACAASTRPPKSPRR